MSSVERKPRGGVYLVIVDSSEECQAALQYACEFANAEKGYVALLNVIEDSYMHNWRNIEKRVRKELRQQAEQTIWDASGYIIEKTGAMPIVYIEDGDRSDVIVDVLSGDSHIVALVLGAASASNPGPLVNYFSAKGRSRLPVPLIVVPAHLEDKDDSA